MWMVYWSESEKGVVGALAKAEAEARKMYSVVGAKYNREELKQVLRVPISFPLPHPHSLLTAACV